MTNYKRCNVEWMKGNFGVSVHWTPHSVLLDGTCLPFEEATNGFDVEKFAETLASINAGHCILTVTHALQQIAMPHPLLDSILPGRTTKRDLIGELIEALDKRGIRFIAYYNHSCNNNDDVEWKKACGYADGIHGNLDHFAENICGIVSFIAKRYGTGLAGWWFDSSYSVDPHGPHNTITCDMGDWRFPWQALCDAAKSGNPDCAVTFNAGIGSRFLYADCQDYYAGETVNFDEPFTPDALPDICDHRWICADDTAWMLEKMNYKNGFAPLRLPTEELIAFRDKHLAEKRMVTFNFQIDQLGHINPNIRLLQ